MKITTKQLKQIIKEELSGALKEKQLEEGNLEDVSLAAFLAMGVGLGAWTIVELTRPAEHPTLQQWEGEIDESVILDVQQRVQSPQKSVK